jgi:hypothetical protein
MLPMGDQANETQATPLAGMVCRSDPFTDQIWIAELLHEASKDPSGDKAAFSSTPKPITTSPGWAFPVSRGIVDTIEEKEGLAIRRDTRMKLMLITANLVLILNRGILSSSNSNQSAYPWAIR